MVMIFGFKNSAIGDYLWLNGGGYTGLAGLNASPNTVWNLSSRRNMKWDFMWDADRFSSTVYNTSPYRSCMLCRILMWLAAASDNE